MKLKANTAMQLNRLLRKTTANSQPVPFESTGIYDCWHPDYGDLDSFVAHLTSPLQFGNSLLPN